MKKITKTPDRTWTHPKIITSKKKFITQRKIVGLSNFIRKKIVAGWELEEEVIYEILIGDEPVIYFNKESYADYYLAKRKPDHSQRKSFLVYEVIYFSGLEFQMNGETLKKLFKFQHDFKTLQQI